MRSLKFPRTRRVIVKCQVFVPLLVCISLSVKFLNCQAVKHNGCGQRQRSCHVTNQITSLNKQWFLNSRNGFESHNLMWVFFILKCYRWIVFAGYTIVLNYIVPGALWSFIVNKQKFCLHSVLSKTHCVYPCALTNVPNPPFLKSLNLHCLRPCLPACSLLLPCLCKCIIAATCKTETCDF